jgi:hypothetical protein
MGDVRKDMNDLTAAVEAYEYGLQLFGKLFGLTSYEPGPETDYAESKLKIAGVYLLLGRKESALQLLYEAKNTLVDLEKRASLSRSQKQLWDQIEKELSTLKNREMLESH